MDLLERYLQAIGQYLPAANRHDVLAELRANLQARLDDRAEELNRPLTQPEVAAILQAHGRPVVVAARYLPQQYLIGPAIFPYYLVTLRRVAPFALLIFFLANCSSMLFVQNFPELIAGILRALGLLIPNLIYFAAWVTFAFAIAEFVYTRNHAKPLLASWDPTRLPRLTVQTKGKSRASRIADVIFQLLFLLYVLEIPSHPFLILGPSQLYLHKFSIAFSSAWHTYYILLLVVLTVQLFAKIAALSFRLDSLHPATDLANNVFGFIATAYLVSMKTYLVATSAATSQAKLAEVNHWIGFSFRIVLVIVAVQILIDTWKLLRPRIAAHSLAF